MADNVPEKPKGTSSARMMSTMGSVGCIAGVLIVMTFQLTFPRIERQKEEYLRNSVFEVLPGTTKLTIFKITNDGIFELWKDKGDKKSRKIYAGYDDNGAFTGVAVQTQGQGFQDAINLLYGYSPKKQCIVGMKILASKETPGLGDKIEKDADFLANFKALKVVFDPVKKQVTQPIKTKKKKEQDWEIEAITGATISSNAIGEILRKSTIEVIPLILDKENLRRLEER